MTTVRPPNPLSTAGLDRLGLIRKHPDRLREHFASTEVRAVPICGGKVCVSTDNPPKLVHLDVDDLDGTWLLGTCDGVTYVATDVEPDRNDLGPDARLAGLREVAAMLPPLEGNLLAMATGLAIWHDTHRYCGKCGEETIVDWAGHRRRCDGCGREHYPRTDPAIIVLVTHDDRALLARNPMWPAGFASVLAGFGGAGGQGGGGHRRRARWRRVPLVAAVAVPGVGDARVHGVGRVGRARLRSRGARRRLLVHARRAGARGRRAATGAVDLPTSRGRLVGGGRVITHIVTFKLTDDRREEADRCKALLDGLVGVVPSLRSMVVGVNVVASPRAHTLALIATFDDLAGLEAYQVHPAHEEVAGALRAASSSIAAVDFES